MSKVSKEEKGEESLFCWRGIRESGERISSFDEKRES